MENKNYDIEDFLSEKNLKLYNFSNNQLDIIKKGLNSNIDKDKLFKYIDCKFTYKQMKEIYLGLLSGVNVDTYASKIYDSYQMEQIRLGLEKKVDVRFYLDPRFKDVEMEQIRYGLIINNKRKNRNKKLINIKLYANVKYNYLEMKTIREYLEKRS